MDPPLRASVVVPVFNQVVYTRICLASLALAGWDDTEVVVVDNGSSDQTAEFLSQWSAAGAGRRVVSPGKNLGFAKGCNRGAAAARGEFVAFLNNDTFVLPDWLPRLLEPFAEPGVTITGSLLLYPDGRVQHAGLAFDERGPHHIFAGLRADHPAVTQRHDWQAVTGASLAIRKSDFQRLGGFDEGYRNSFEDVDLCLRVRAEGGRIVYVPTSVAYHFESVSEGRLGPTDHRNYERFIKHWRGRYQLDLRPILDVTDTSDRVPPKVELLHALRRAESRTAELEGRMRLLDQVEDRMRDYEFALGLPSVRALLAVRRLLRRAVPESLARRVRARSARRRGAGAPEANAKLS